MRAVSSIVELFPHREEARDRYRELLKRIDQPPDDPTSPIDFDPLILEFEL